MLKKEDLSLDRYAIFFLLKGDSKTYKDKLSKYSAIKFNEKRIFESKVPAHVTLKGPFETRNIVPIKNILRQFAKNQNTTSIKITGFGHFNKSVIFLNFKFPESAKKIQKDLVSELKNFDDILITRHDLDFHPHSTISYVKDKDKFRFMWHYFEKLKCPKFQMKFDHIALMKKDNNQWVLYRKFKFR